MTPDTRALVEQWWADVFDVEVEDLWHARTVHDHALLADHAGWWAAWRDGTTHVSAPAGADGRTLAELDDAEPETLSTTAFWESFAAVRALDVVGPSVHSYLDDDPGEDPSVPRLDPAFLGHLRASVGDDEWSEAGFADEPSVVFGCFADGELVAAANLAEFAGRPRDVGLLVRSDHRGRGLGHRVAGAAASYAVRHHGLARWRSSPGNDASRAIARELGFEDYATQLAVRASRA